ncbi:chemotaxis protein CheB (plasmid) [Ensifer adhaerens]|uniref:chemotaxis protein CheB n=1 Tax=Ensifer adhaerens TaxID=106592 RepID=UPI001CBD0522|nr:chemotaxis protein CheB [Ensifer adhaerens]MBZ7927668.1 chemotaxis protein CheB [Ensifer adhaerens]UAX98064.1 chemotaxis protein CheB [Ensifer adhaerens]UAY05445.1 chemotaxis protein CheB [Ensifer adhaerens]UAY12823.1 chemotaxis protein CheB [Ensifer adhaerens]
MGTRNFIAIGGSVGSVAAVKQLLSQLPVGFAPSVFIALHVGARGSNLLADIFAENAPIPVTTAVDSETIEAGHVYVAPADRHLIVSQGLIWLGKGPRENLSRPAIDPLFRSVGADYGAASIGLVLSGMLNDGAAGLADLKRCGGIAIVQNPADAEAPDMPVGALAATDVDYRASLADLPKLLVKLVGEPAGSSPPVADDIKLEIDIALGRQSGAAVIAEIAGAVPLSCPSCGGVLSQIKSSPPLRFRCQVGHAFTSDVLASDEEGTVTGAVRMALRVIEERITLSEKMAEDARRSGRKAAALANEKRAEESRGYAEVLRRGLAEGF